MLYSIVVWKHISLPFFILSSVFVFLCFTTVHITKAFSISWVHEDLLAHPQYKVFIYENQLIQNSSLEKFAFDDVQTESSKVPTLSQSSSEDNEDSKYISVIMRTATRQPYVCQIPYIANQTSDEENPEENREDVDLMRKGLALLEPLQNNCLYYNQGWWTYEYCHLSHVKQFHQIIRPNMKPIEDRSVASFYLGRYDPRHATLPSSYKDKEGSKNSQQQLGTDLQAGGGKKYLVQRWSDGTKCDLTGKPRKVEIQFHCNPQSKDGISVVTEMSTCYYLVVIHTPRLCNDPAFLSKNLNKVNHIECRRVVSDERFDQYTDKERKSLESGENEGVMSKEKERNDDELNDPSGSENERTRQEIKNDKLKNIVAKVADSLKKRVEIHKDEGSIEEENNNAKGHPIQIYFMDENGQWTLVDGNEAVLKRNEYEKDEPSYSDYQHILESLITQNLQVRPNNPFKRKDNFESDYYQQSHQAKLSLIYEMDYENDNDDKKKKIN